MKPSKIHAFVMTSLLCLSLMSMQIVDTYNFKMTLKIPRIYDNMQSQGYRKYQRQHIQGDLTITYNEDGIEGVKISNLVNKTHKMSNGKNITYKCSEYPYDDGDTLIVGVGSNKTLTFKQMGIRFSFVADPSYNIGEVSEDNSLYLELSGIGNLPMKQLYNNQIPSLITGSVIGQQGCGCTEYGHISPTRWYFGYLTDIVTDIAPVDGTWRAKFKSRSQTIGQKKN